MLALLGSIIVFVAIIISAIYSIQILIMNFQENVLWGLASLFFGLPSLIFLVMRWEKAGPPFIKSLIAIPVAIVGSLLIMMGSGS